MLSDVEKVVTCGKMVGFVAPSEKKPMSIQQFLVGRK
jgi:hypothetical protein